MTGVRTTGQLLDDMHMAMCAQSADDFADLYAVDATYEFPLMTPGRPEFYHGREAIRAGFSKAWADAPLHVEGIHGVVVHETKEPQLLIAEQHAALIHIETKRRFRLPFLMILRSKDGELTNVRDYSDALRGAQELGRMKELFEALSD